MVSRSFGRFFFVVKNRHSILLSPRLVNNRHLTTNTENGKHYREVIEIQEGDVTEIEGVFRVSASNFEEVDDHLKACPICSRNLQFKYTDVLILSQFVRPDGSVLPRRITGVCARQHKRIVDYIDKAQKEGLLPKPDLTNFRKPPSDLRLPKGVFHTYYVDKLKKNILKP